jgi:hypothetical protein
MRALAAKLHRLGAAQQERGSSSPAGVSTRPPTTTSSGCVRAKATSRSIARANRTPGNSSATKSADPSPDALSTTITSPPPHAPAAGHSGGAVRAAVAGDDDVEARGVEPLAQRVAQPPMTPSES